MSDHQYIESMSGPPRLVDGPGCTPAVACNHAETCCKGPEVCTHGCTPAVANEAPQEDQADPAEFQERGGLYSDKCEDCTTGASCEDAGRCLFGDYEDGLR